MMKSFLIKIIKYGFVALLLVNILSWLSLYILSKSEFYKPSYLVNHYNNEQLFDFVILGSSRGLTTINTGQLDKNINTRSVNLSIDDTSLPSHCLMLKHFLSNNFKAKKIILNLDEQSFVSSVKELNNNDYRFAPFLFKKSINSYYNNYETSSLKQLSLSKYLPFLTVSYYNTELFFPSIIALTDSKRRNRFDLNGNYSYPNNSFSYKGGVTNQNLKLSNPLLKQMNDLCIQNNMELIIYIAPMINKNIIVYNELNLEIINHSDLLVDDAYFYDPGHVNIKGRELATKALADELR